MIGRLFCYLGWHRWSAFGINKQHPCLRKGCKETWTIV